MRVVLKILEAEITVQVGAEANERMEPRRGYRNGPNTRGLKRRVRDLILRVPWS